MTHNTPQTPEPLEIIKTYSCRINESTKASEKYYAKRMTKLLNRIQTNHDIMLKERESETHNRRKHTP